MSENNDNQQTLTNPFVNRTGENLNRRKLTIISQTPNEMIVDIARADNLDTENGTKIDADTLNSKFQSIVNQINTVDTGTMVKIGSEFCPDLTFTSDPQTQINTTNNNIANISNNTTKLQNTPGGFAAGNSSQATAGGAVGMNSTTASGFAGGHSATSDWGGAIGVNASTQLGGAVGSEAISTNGGAIGSYTKTGNGFAGGYNARTTDADGNGIDAIQLGTGTNNQANTLQVYGDNIYNATTHTLNTNNATSTNFNSTNANISNLSTNVINSTNAINTNSCYKINNVQTGRNRTKIGDYTCPEGQEITIGSLANYSFYEIVFNGVSGRKITTGLISCVNNTYFSIYYPNVGGIRGYKVSDTKLKIEDTDGTTSFSVYGIN